MNARLASLLGRVYRALSNDARPRAAMRLWHEAGGEWSIANATLTLQVLAEPRPDPVRVPLTPPATLATVAAAALAAGWRVDDLDPELRQRGAIAMIDQEPTTTAPVLIHDSILWALFTAYAAVLDEAAVEADALPAQVRTDTATGIWTDYHGTYFGVPRLPGEPDATYAQRIVAEVLRPKSNNYAMAAIISRVTGQTASVIDVTDYAAVVPSYDGSIIHDGTYFHDASAKAIKGLFDVVVAFDLLGSTNPATFQAAIIAQVERLRAAGTLLRDIALAGGNIDTDAPGAADFRLHLTPTATLADSPDAPADASLPLAGAFDVGDPAAAPDDEALPLTAEVPDLASAAAGANDFRIDLTTDAALDEAADAPADTSLPLTGGPDLADTADTPSEAAEQAATLATLPDTAPGPADTSLPLTGGPDLADTAPGPADTSLPVAMTAATMTDAAAAPTESGDVTQDWTHTLDGTWTLSGNRPLASGVPLILPL